VATKPVEHHGQRYPAYIPARLVHCSKWHWQQFRELDVVNTYNSDILWNALIERN